MLYLLLLCFSFIFLSTSFLESIFFSEMGFRSLPLLWQGFSRFLVSWFRKNKNFLENLCHFSRTLFPARKNRVFVKARSENAEDSGEMTMLLDLPDLVIESILETLSPSELRAMAGVCRALREKCVADFLWERHLRRKWGDLIGSVACREWKCCLDGKKRDFLLSDSKNQWDFSGYFSSFKEYFVLNEKKSEFGLKSSSSAADDSVMALYFSLEAGKFWFPAQVYNREYGNAGFVLSCYDAEVSYDSSTELFWARYPAHGRSSIEENIALDRLREAPVGTSAYVLHNSDCLHDLKPDDHIEIQWRRSKEFPYGWWYGVVGHLGSCNGNKFDCNCHRSDTVKLEFRQYSPESQWRETVVNREGHREVGNEAHGYYGGIRKLYSEDEISVWKQFWPNCTLLF